MNEDLFRTPRVLIPLVSVIIPCRNERDGIDRCLRSICSQQEPLGGFEVVVADGRSTDGTRDLLNQFAAREPRLRVIDNPGKIVSTGLNAAIQASRGQVIIRIDAHTEYAPDYLVHCVEVLEVTKADNVGGPWIAKGGDYISRAIAAAFQCRWVIGGARGHDSRYEGEVDTVYLGCWRKETFSQFGFFDEELVRNQDDELSLRITKGGGNIWQSPRIRSWYHPRNSLFPLFRQYMQYGYWKVRVIQKHRLPASLRHLVPAVFVISLVVLGLAGIIYSPAMWLWLLIVAAYAGFNLLASVSSAHAGGWSLLPVLPAVVAAYHFGYGYGFLRGIIDFVFLKKGKSKAFTKLTR